MYDTTADKAGRAERFEEWLREGQEQGFVGPAVCCTHDSVPTTEAEDDEWEDGDDICIHILRLYADIETKSAVEANHAPSVWRA
ncbi:hypothetical protein [Agromyces humi]|uniref:hypothetical protein n=1 Tax=Agromyces humi TaxID=1766800 RepID=UPI0013577E5E|nr:hypothetical protein [Agromyces humi]